MYSVRPFVDVGNVARLGRSTVGRVALVAALDAALARCTENGELAGIWARHLPFLAFPLTSAGQ